MPEQKKKANILIQIGSDIASAWNWLDGKKTAIGTGALLVSKVFPEHTAAHQVLAIIGELFGGVGLFHKGQKSYKEKYPEGLRK